MGAEDQGGDNKTDILDTTASEMTETPWDEEAAQKLLDRLEKITDKDSETIFGMGSITTVKQLIDSIKNRTPQGARFVRLSQRVEADLESRQSGKKEEIIESARDVISKIKGLFI